MFLFERNPRSTIKKGRKAPKTTVVCCRTSDALKAEVDALCRRNNLTTSELVKNFIENVSNAIQPLGGKVRLKNE